MTVVIPIGKIQDSLSRSFMFCLYKVCALTAMIFVLHKEVRAQNPSDSSTISGLRIRVVNLTRQDETFLDLTPGHDSVAVSKLDNPGITIALGTNLQRFSIAGLSVVEEAGLVPLNIRRAGSNNLMIISKTGPEMPFYALFLKDDAEGTISFLAADSSEFTFSASGNDADRFSLLIQSSATSTGFTNFKQPSGCPQIKDRKIQLSNLESANSIIIIDPMGRRYLEKEFIGRNELDLPFLSPGIYQILLGGTGKNCRIILP